MNLIDVSTIEDLEGQIARLMHHNQPNPYGADYVCVFCFKSPASAWSNAPGRIEHTEDCDGERLLRELREAREPKDHL